MLFDQDARRQRRRRSHHPDTGTAACRTIGPIVESGGDQVHGRSAHADTVDERLTLRVETGE